MKKFITAILSAALTVSSLVNIPLTSSAYELENKAVAGNAQKNVYAAQSGITANPLISRNVPAYSGKSATASAGNDAYYYSSWTSSAEDYIAYDLSSVSTEQRKQVIAVWYNLSSYDNIGLYVTRNAEPIDYTIEVNSAPGGTYPTDGWKTAEDVKNNEYSSRQHVVNMDGYNWIRMNVTKALGNNINLNFDIHDASHGVSDSWIFFGDSITAGGMNNAYGTGFATFVNSLDSRFFPVQENGGIGGITSNDGRNNIDKWLSTSPAKYVSIAFGTNDAWGNPYNTEKYYSNTKYMVDAIINAGKIPVLPKIPYSTNPDVGSNVGYYNAMIDKLYSEYGNQLLQGADFDKFFRDNPQYLSSDGVHPSSDGYEAMRKFWAESMYKNLYSVNVLVEKTFYGDINLDGSVTPNDIIPFIKHFLNEKLSGQALLNADVQYDGEVDIRDLAKLKQYSVGDKLTLGPIA